MIIKSYEINKIIFDKNRLVLFYGKNEGFKNEAINYLIKNKDEITRYEEKEILENINNFTESILSKSLFESEKIIIIKRASDKDTSDYKEVVFEGYAPHGVAVLVETATDNNNRTVANIRSYFNKNNGSLGTSGSVVFMFDHTCNFRIADDGTDPEDLELDLIDYGAEEVFKDEDGVLIYASFENFGDIQKYLEENNKEILSSGFERIAQLTKELSKEQEEEVNKLLEKIEEDDDVQNVYHTMKDSIED